MEKDDRPLFSLTVAEYKELLNTLQVPKPLEITDRPKEPSKGEPDLIYLKESALLTGYTPKTIYSKVCKNEMPVVSTGRPLTFSRKQLNDWIKRGRPTVPEMIAEDYLKNSNTKK